MPASPFSAPLAPETPARPAGSTWLPSWWRRRLRLSSDQLLLAVALYFALACNTRFLADALAGRTASQPGTWGFALALVTMLAALHALLLAPLLHRRLARPLLALLVVAAAVAGHAIDRFGSYLDPTMLRNVLHTNWAEARELLGADLLGHLLLTAGLPLLLLARVELVVRPWRRALAARAALAALALLALLLPLWASFGDVAALMRNQRELRYRVTPANLLYSAGRALATPAAAAPAARRVVGADAHRGPIAAARSKPLLLVLVVGETARAANWGLSGYARQTTPELAALDVLNFRDVRACGTNTETSLPCMFAAIGRRDYDEARIRGSDSLLHVAARAGVQVRWIDNQSGCKGVCEGLAQQRLDAASQPALCDGDRCLDEALLPALQAGADPARGDQLVVLHMLGNHGPAYHARYPAALRRFEPACETPELRRCSREQIVNAYDNALLYTDQVLAQTVRWLVSQQARFDTGLVYLSDHGESLGENGLYLHGVPYAIAPDVQTRVPMVWWLSPGLLASTGLDRGCLAAQTARPWTHDDLFHTTLGLLDVRTTAYEPALDIAAPCRH
ncbi:phosphoethanolamine transferase [Aquabacterium humicola]|uniref:phosphoethanolamine transferase n=1 Tax=Aquabacterium humicola TaxID=3237377 RepID=UPI0025427AFD|nr:phosphoethanolamine--lipid A transferase [Rubrivivax pictus]